MAALRRLDVDIELPAEHRVGARLSLRRLPVVADALALVIAVAVTRGHPVAVAAAIVSFCALNADTARLRTLDLRVGLEVGSVLTRIALPLLVLLSAGALGLVPQLRPAQDAETLLLTGAVAAVLVAAGRASAYAVARAARARGLASEPTLIVGSGALGVELADALDRHPEYGLRPIGFVDGPTTADLPHPLLGGPHDLPQLVEEYEVKRVVVAFGHNNDGDLAMLLRSMEGLPVEVHVVPRFFDLGSVPDGSTDSVRGIPLIHLRRPGTRPLAVVTKRAFDAGVAGTLLLALAPVLAIIALAVASSSPGPVLFRQVRVGRRGAPFVMLKFRTMRVGDEAESRWTPEHDRITRVGRFLRRTSLDELPQLVNVLRGEMSLVGPRPEVPHFVERFTASVPTYADRHRAPGGITGLAQVHGRDRGIGSIPERARLDNSYIETRSMWADLLIIVRTVEVALRGDRW